MATANDALSQFQSLVGIAESPPHSNLTPIGDEYGWNGVAWCCETVSVVLTRVGINTHYASCWFCIQGYKNGDIGAWLGKPDISVIQPGDQVFYGPNGSDHTGMVKQVDVAGGRILTLEGNIGDAVREQWRPYSGGSLSVFGFGRPPYDGAPVAPAPAPTPPSLALGALLWPELSTRTRAKYPTHTSIVQDCESLASPVDGDYFTATASGVKDFQMRHGLYVDGVCGRVTGLAIVQVDLNFFGFNAGDVDGKMGPQTTEAIKAFQRSAGLTADGEFGNDSTAALWAKIQAS